MKSVIFKVCFVVDDEQQHIVTTLYWHSIYFLYNIFRTIYIINIKKWLLLDQMPSRIIEMILLKN